MVVDESRTTLDVRRVPRRREAAAAGLAARGIGENTIVSWILPTTNHAFVLVGALARLGAIQNPILPIYREREVGFIAKQAAAAADRPRRVPRVRLRGDGKTSPRMPRPRGHRSAKDTIPDGRPVGVAAASTRPETRPLAVLHVRLDRGPKGRAAHRPDAPRRLEGHGRLPRLSPGRLGSIVFPFTHIAGPDYLVMVLTDRLLPSHGGVRPGRRRRSSSRGRASRSPARDRVPHRCTSPHSARRPASRVIPTCAIPGWRCAEAAAALLRHEGGDGRADPSGYGHDRSPILAMARPYDTDDKLANTEGRPVVGSEVRSWRPTRQAGTRRGGRGARATAPQVCKGYTDPAARRRCVRRRRLVHDRRPRRHARGRLRRRSPGGSRTSSSARARTSPRRRWRTCSSRTRRSATSRSSGCPIPSGESACAPSSSRPRTANTRARDHLRGDDADS